MGCKCINKDEKEEGQIITGNNNVKNEPDVIVENEFNKEDCKDIELVEVKEEVDNNTDLETNYVKEKDETTNRFNTRVFQLINQIRRDPPAYANTILDNIQYIIQENNKLIFKKKVKVLLNKGEPAFREAAEALKTINPMDDLIMKNEIAIPLPLSKEEINDNNIIINHVNNIRKDYNINVYFKNMIKNPEIAVLLLIVDDSLNNPGAKRNAILNPSFRKIGINSNFIDTTFVSFFSFSK